MLWMLGGLAIVALFAITSANLRKPPRRRLRPRRRDGDGPIGYIENADVDHASIHGSAGGSGWGTVPDEHGDFEAGGGSGGGGGASGSWDDSGGGDSGGDGGGD